MATRLGEWIEVENAWVRGRWLIRKVVDKDLFHLIDTELNISGGVYPYLDEAQFTATQKDRQEGR